MNIILRDDKVIIDGYVNAVERNSKPLMSRLGRFFERICKGAFAKALDRAEDVRILLDHNPDRDLGGIKDGNLHLEEDTIGLRAHAEITDAKVIETAREGNLVGWSFGFYDTEDGVELSMDADTGLPVRKVTDLILEEVSLLDKSMTPAYDGTLVTVRNDGKTISFSETSEDMELRYEQSEQLSADDIDYSTWENMIEEMKGDKA